MNLQFSSGNSPDYMIYAVPAGGIGPTGGMGRARAGRRAGRATRESGSPKPCRSPNELEGAIPRDDRPSGGPPSPGLKDGPSSESADAPGDLNESAVFANRAVPSNSIHAIRLENGPQEAMSDSFLTLPIGR